MEWESEIWRFVRIRADRAVLERRQQAGLSEQELVRRAEDMRNRGIEPDVTEAALAALRERQGAGEKTQSRLTPGQKAAIGKARKADWRVAWAGDPGSRG